MFPTTIWTTIQQAGAREPAALEAVARRYRPPVLEFIQRRGFLMADAEDLCQDVFVRVLRGGVLAKADRDRGRFRSLILSVTVRAIQDRLRKRGERPAADVDPPHREPVFDEGWALHLVERALDHLREEGSPHYDVLHGHLTGRARNRNKLWKARRKLASLIRQEVAYTCATRADYEAELAYLAPYLRPSRKK